MKALITGGAGFIGSNIASALIAKGARVRVLDDLERPDMLVLSVTAADTALRLRTLLQAEGLESWPKLTGGRELHVMVPIEPDLNAADVDGASRIVEGTARSMGITVNG